MKKAAIILGSMIFVAIAFRVILAATQIEPSIGLYWYITSDPTAGGGVCAPMWQLAIRTDVPGIYAKTGNACTAWTGVAGSGISGVTGNGTSGTLAIFSGATTIRNLANTDVATIATSGAGPKFSPPQLANGDNSNWNPTGLTTHSYVSVLTDPNGSRLVGIGANSSSNGFVDGQLLCLWNSGDGNRTPSSTLTIAQQTDTSTFNQVYIPGERDLTLTVGAIACLRYFTPHINGAQWNLDPIATANLSTVIVNWFSFGNGLSVTLNTGGNDNDLNPTNGNNFSRWTLSSITNGSTITGISAPSNTCGREIVLVNEGDAGGNTTSVVTLKENSGSSGAGNRFHLPGAHDAIIPLFGSLRIIYECSYKGGSGFWFADASQAMDWTGLNMNAVSPTALTSSSDTVDWDPWNGATPCSSPFIRASTSGAATATLGGMLACAQGSVICIGNFGSGSITINTNDGTEATATRKFVMSANNTLANGQSMCFRYDQLSGGRWWAFGKGG